MIDKLHKTIIFTKTPLEGYFRYKDKFQIYPADLDGIPKSSLQEHYPVILEYIIEEDEIITPVKEIEGLKDLQTLTASTLTKQDEILNLLTLFTNHIFFRYQNFTGTWGIPVLSDNPGEDANKWSSKWNLITFHWPGLPEQLKIKEFTAIESKFHPVKFNPDGADLQSVPPFTRQINTLLQHQDHYLNPDGADSVPNFIYQRNVLLQHQSHYLTRWRGFAIRAYLYTSKKYTTSTSRSLLNPA